MGLASRCKVAGDFDVQVDYKLPKWPAQNFVTVRLMASDLPDGGTGFPGVYRNSYADENYQFRNQRADVVRCRPCRNLAPFTPHLSPFAPFKTVGGSPRRRALSGALG
jgi:hypothetical protein